jgi:uncharacterized membrane protein YdjX (TVP38/TMEM64 family)
MKLHKLQRWVFKIFILIVALSLLLYGIFADEISIEALRGNIRGFGIWAPLVFIILYALGTIFIPSTPFMLVAGILFGLKYGLIYTLISGFISSVLLFSFSRKLGKPWVESIVRKKDLGFIEKYNKRLGSGGVIDLIVLRMMPIMPFNILNIIMGISKISLRNYIIGTMIGLFPSVGITVYAGTLLSHVF